MRFLLFVTGVLTLRGRNSPWVLATSRVQVGEGIPCSPSA